MGKENLTQAQQERNDAYNQYVKNNTYVQFANAYV